VEDVVAVQVGIRPLGSSSVVSLSGLADRALLVRLAEAIAECTAPGGVLLVEIDDLLVSNLDTIRGLVGTLLARVTERPVAFCCRRVTGRRLLRRCGGDEVRVFARIDDALTALVAPAAA
jgi:hypothetical protein